MAEQSYLAWPVESPQQWRNHGKKDALWIQGISSQLLIESVQIHDEVKIYCINLYYINIISEYFSFLWEFFSFLSSFIYGGFGSYTYDCRSLMTDSAQTLMSFTNMKIKFRPKILFLASIRILIHNQVKSVGSCTLIIKIDRRRVGRYSGRR